MPALYVNLMRKYQDLGYQRSSRPENPDQRRPNKAARFPHRTEALRDSASAVSPIGFTTGQRARSDSGRPTMTVRAILDTKGHDIQSVEPQAKLAFAIKILGERKIGAVVVMSAGRIEGILSERDIVPRAGRTGCCGARRTHRRGDDEEGHQLQAVRHRRRDHGDDDAGKIPPPAGGRGREGCRLISIGDIVKWRVREYEMEQEALRDYIKTA